MPEATLEVGAGSPGAGLRLSVSQIQKFTSCENRWYLAKTLPADDRRFASSEAMDLGTLWHTLKAAWWSGAGWEKAWLAAAVEAVGVKRTIGWKLSRGKLVEQPGYEVPTIFLRAKRFMEQWVEVHGRSPAEDTDPILAGSTLIATELPFELPVPGVKGAIIRGFMDGLVSTPVDGIRVHDRKRIIEEKSMGKWGREDSVPYDLQLNVYLWAARQMFQVDGAVFEATSTAAYNDKPAGFRFKRIPLDYDQRVVDRTMQDVTRAARRMNQILKNPGLIVRNVGEACTYCDFKQQCLTPWET